MSDPVIKIPVLNSLRFHKVGSGDFSQNQIPFMEDQNPRYLQKYQFGDLLYVQFLIQGMSLAYGVYTPVLKLIDNNGVTAHTFQVEATSTAVVYTGYSAYNVTENFPTVPEGVYFLQLNCHAPKDPIGLDYAQMTFLSEPIHLAATHENTVLIKYRLTYNDFDCIFTDELAYFNLRIEGGVKSDGFVPGGKFQMFEDLDYEPVMLQAIPYNLYKWIFGPCGGVPNWIGSKLNMIFSCDDITIDDVAWMRGDGAKLEATRETGYPFASWAIDLLKVENEHSENYGLDSFGFDRTVEKFDSNIITFDKTLI